MRRALFRVVTVAAIAVGALVALVAMEAPARAYPQWQLSTGATRCNQCHYAPGGGGLVTSYGRDADGEELSTFEGNGALLHGAVTLPSWVALGGDLRGATLANDVQDPSGATYAAFPMQADVYARVAPGAGFSVYATGGLRGQIRDPNAIVPDQNFQPISTSQLISREHWAMYQPEVIGYYVRAGRFFAPFGLRLAEHITYIRRDLGFDLLEESYNLSGGFVYPDWELHVTGFVPDFVRHIGSNETGVAAMYERRLLDGHAAIGPQTKIAVEPGFTRFILGAVGKLYVEPARALFLAEVDTVFARYDSDAVGTRAQLVGAGGVALLPVRGLVVTLLGERNQTDLAVRDAAWTAATGLVSWFPYAHFEVQVLGRAQFPAGGVAAKTLLAQLHYFL